MKNYMRNSIWTACLAIVVLAAGGCGYHLTGYTNPMLNSINTIAVPYFKNKTFEAGIESIFTRAFADAFIKNKRLRVVGVDAADVILRGTVKSSREDIISYNKDDKALEYRIFVTLDLTLEKRDTGEILWKRKGLRNNEEYQVSNDIVVTQKGKEIALQKIAQDLAQRVEESIIQGF
jgi:outer membrane lipopolysaccharide assembly protein LptE/RlpB